MTSPVISLSEGFPAASHADWLALVTRTLKGADADSLIARTADGLPVRPLYTAEDAPAPLPVQGPARSGDRAWDIRSVVSAADPSAANAEALEALAGGAASILIRIGPCGGPGVEHLDEDTLPCILGGVMTEVAPVALDAGFLGPLAANRLGAAAKASPNARLLFHLDPLSAFATAGVSPGPVEAHLQAAAAATVRLAETYPKAGLFLASGAAVHEAGGSPAWELAFAAAASVAYAKALVAAGLDMTTAFAGVTLGAAVDAEPLGGVAKLRAARILWGRITRACGVDRPAIVEARSSGRMLTRADRWTNLVRLTSAGFAAAIGGADAIVLGAFTDALGRADRSALRMARNTQLILMEEAHLGRVADPAAGAWAMEAQTEDLARAAWDAFVAIEAAGGLAEALRAGLVAEAVSAGRRALQEALAAKSLRIIGVTDYTADEAALATDTQAADANALPDARQPGPDSRCPPMPAIRLEEMAQ